MTKTTFFKFRCSEYERAIVKELKKAAEVAGTTTLTESDVVRIAIMEFAKKNLAAAKLANLQRTYLDQGDTL